MPSKAEKLLEQMRNSKAGWKRADLDTLYEGYGFVISHGSNHDIVKHPAHPELRATLPRHRQLARGYVEFAVKLINSLLYIENESDGKNE